MTESKYVFKRNKNETRLASGCVDKTWLFLGTCSGRKKLKSGTFPSVLNRFHKKINQNSIAFSKVKVKVSWSKSRQSRKSSQRDKSGNFILYMVYSDRKWKPFNSLSILENYKRNSCHLEMSKKETKTNKMAWLSLIILKRN